MNSQLIQELTAQLYRQKSSLLEGAAAENRETRVADERESEIEESAQIDRITQLRNQLDERSQMMIREIDAALERVDSGIYGLCGRCKEEIAAARLRALPTATFCMDCATTVEKERLAAREEAEHSRVIYDEFEDDSY